MWELPPPKDECRLSYRVLNILVRFIDNVQGTIRCPPSSVETKIVIMDEKDRAVAMEEGSEALSVYLRAMRDGPLCPRCGKNMGYNLLHPTYMCPNGFKE